MARTDGRIAIPRNVEDVLDLATEVFTKHTNGGVSRLPTPFRHLSHQKPSNIFTPHSKT